MPATLPDRQYAAPPAADGVALVLLGGSWGNSDIEELIAAAEADLILTGIVVRPVGLIFTGYSFEVDILTGAEDAESVIATFRGYLQEVNSNTGSEGLYLPTIIGVDNIPSGERVSARWRAQTTATHTAHVSMSYLAKPLTGTLDTTANPLLCYPSAATHVSVVTGTSWATGTAVELFDGSGPARAIVGVVAKIDSASIEFEVDLCTGVGNDVVTTLRGSGGGVSSFPNHLAMPHPLTIPASTSLSARSRSDDAFALTVIFSVAYFEMPL